MDKQQLGEALGKIGKAFFVKNYQILADLSKPIDTVVTIIMEGKTNGTKNCDGTKISVSRARTIFQAERQCDALEFIAQSKKPELADKAKRVLAEFCGS